MQSVFETAVFVAWGRASSRLIAGPDASHDASTVDLQAVVHVRSPAICSLDPILRRGMLHQRSAGHTTPLLVALPPLAFVCSPLLLSNHPRIAYLITAVNA
jgi:hypothetical protein